MVTSVLPAHPFRRLIRLKSLAAVPILATLGSTAPAAANEFTINACQADRANYSTQAFEDFATRGMKWKRACDPEGPGLRGLVTSNVVRSGRVPRGARSYFVMRAPDGTRFARLSWSGQARRRDCRYALQLWASRPDGPPVPIKNVRANRHCPRKNLAQAAGWPRARTYDIAGATSIVQRVICVGSSQTRYCSSRGLNYIRTFKAQATVVDISPPAVSIVQDNPFTRGEWVGGMQSVTYEASDNSGVRLVRPVFPNGAFGGVPRACDYAQRVPCASGPGSITIDTRTLAEGSQVLTLRGEDAAGNPGDSAPVTARIDNTPPGAVGVALESGQSWRNQNDFAVSWQNPDEGDRAPITAVHYRLCRAGGQECVEHSQSGWALQRLDGLRVPEPGEWQLRLWRQDAAGNHEPANASLPVALRFDPEPPQLGFEAPAAADPTLISVSVTDKVSGLAGGQIELSQAGSGSWYVLPTQQNGDRLVARIDDASLPPGTFLLRATARDHAGNLNSTDRRQDGQPMVISLPLRIRTVLSAGFMQSRTVTRTIRHGGRRKRVRDRVEVSKPIARVAYASRTEVQGVLANADGQPIADAEIEVFSRDATNAEHLAGVVRTDALGRYSYAVLANSSRTLRFVYRGTALYLPTVSEVTLLVRAASTIRAKPRRLLNGQTVRFIGKVRSLPAPPAGKLVELQVVLSGRWQTFRTTLTGPDGAWGVRYRFRRSCGVIRYRFRARLPAEAGYPFETGRTRTVQVRVRGRPCR